MPNWSVLLKEVNAAGSTHDQIRRKYLAKLSRYTKRNVIAYYSGWLQKSNLAPSMIQVNDDDKNGFMAVIHGMDRSKGLDLLLHTPGGETAATESLVEYLRSMFGTNIRAFVPQIAMSAGTMIALSCSEIIMGKHSSLGPIDPQIGGIAAHGVVEEFQRAAQEIRENQMAIPLWQPIIAKYNPTFIGECEKALSWSREMVIDWLMSGMFSGTADAEAKAIGVVDEMGDHILTKSHARHISMRRASEIGIRVSALENDQQLQEHVLSVHHACVQTLGSTPAVKLIENHKGIAYINSMQTQVLLANQSMPH